MDFKPARPPATFAQSQHRRQRLLQIWLPLGLTALIVLGVAVWAVVAATAPGPSMTHWANVSAILVILPLCLSAILLLAVVIGLIYLTARIYGRLPGLDRKVQAVFYRIETGVYRAANQSAKPVFSIQGWLASLKALFSAIFKR